MDLWHGMPEFVQEKKVEFKKSEILILGTNQKINIRFNSKKNYDLFLSKCLNYKNNVFLFDNIEELIETASQNVTVKTKSMWYPFKSHWGDIKHKYTSSVEMQPKYPIYIVSKGRYDKCITSRALTRMNVKHYIIVEDFEKEKYESRKSPLAKIIVLPQKYLDNYDTFDEFGSSKSKGPGSARNFAKDHSIELKSKKHWVMDDNIDAFHYLNRNEKLEVECPNTLVACEDFIERFSNVPISGMNYYSFCKKGDKVPPIVLNTRIYSCLLIDNSFDYPWRGRYNEDTDLSLRVLKDGLCTIQFNAFLCGKITTQRMRGGNSEEFYDNEGTLPKSKMLEDMHPDVAKVVWRFNRWHHHVDYKPFKKNELIYKEDYNPKEIKEYYLKKIDK